MLEKVTTNDLKGLVYLVIMNKKLYVGNLPFTAEENQLLALFAGDGRQVTSVTILNDRETGRSRGFGFVEMATPEDAQKAIAALNGHDFMGRPLTVNEAREQAPRTGGGGRGGRAGFGGRSDRDGYGGGDRGGYGGGGYGGGGYGGGYGDSGGGDRGGRGARRDRDRGGRGGRDRDRGGRGDY
jgi:hypothetical protein